MTEFYNKKNANVYLIHDLNNNSSYAYPFNNIFSFAKATTMFLQLLASMALKSCGVITPFFNTTGKGLKTYLIVGLSLPCMRP